MKVILASEPLPKKWDGSPKGCWEQHPKTREICQLPPDGHKVHKRDDSTGTQLISWQWIGLPDQPRCECGLDDVTPKTCPAHQDQFS
jgi:hypothetical protein